MALLAHGYAGSKETLFRYGEALAAAGFICYDVDLPGHGASPRTFTFMNILLLATIAGRFRIPRWNLAALDVLVMVIAVCWLNANPSRTISQYTFISSISVYRDFSQPDQDESAAVAELPQGTAEVEGDQTSYGARKVLCERAGDTSMPGRASNIRPGIIVGPYDATGRLEYWIRPIAAGGEVLAPGNPRARLQLIDGRDLAAWIVRLVEQGQVGTYNAVGPHSVTFGQLLDLCNASTGNKARLLWIPDQYLLEQGTEPFVDLPSWIPEIAEDYRTFFAINGTKALNASPTFRPLAETICDIVCSEDLNARPGESQSRVGLDPQRERGLLSAWISSGISDGRKT